MQVIQMSPVRALFFLAAGSASLSDDAARHSPSILHAGAHAAVSHLQEVNVSERHAEAKPRSSQQRPAPEHKPKVASFVAETAGLARSANVAIHVAAPQVWCGGMFAASCSNCPQGHGESWCHGECSWAEGLCNASPTTTESPRPATTTESPRPATTTASPRPSTPVVESPPAVAKVLVQHSEQSTATAAPAMWPHAVDASALTLPGAAKPSPQALRVVKFTPPVSAGGEPPAATRQAAAPKPVRDTVKFTPPASMKSDPQAANSRVVVPQAGLPQAVLPKAVVPRAVVPQAVVPQAVPQGVVPQGVVPQAVVPHAETPEVVKRTVKFTPPSLTDSKSVAATAEAVASQGGVPQAGPPFVHTASVTPVPVGHFLAGHKKAEECACAFHGDCTCEASMAFMECISSSCAAGCECHDMQYHDACVQLSDACTPVGLSFTCDRERAVCQDSSKANVAPASVQEPAPQTSTSPEAKPLPRIQAPPLVDDVTALYHALSELKEDKCALGLALQEGYVNADSRLTGVQLQIKGSMSKLGDRCLKLPEMHCEKDFEEWSFPPPPCGDEEKTENPLRDQLQDATERGSARSPVSVSLFSMGVVAFAVAMASEI